MRHPIIARVILRQSPSLLASFRSPLVLSFLVALSIVAGAAATAPAVHANTITVTGSGDTLSNNGVCTIREAIINANNNAATWADCAAGAGADTINLPAGTITLSIPNTPSAFSAEELSLRGDLDITSALTINGHTGGTIINGAALDRIFDINPDVDGDGATPTPLITVHLNDLTITNGRQNDVGAVRVLANAVVTIDNSTISNSVSWANDSGGIYNIGTLTMTNCTVSGNSSLLLAGGIKNEGNMTLQSCTVTNNHTTGGTPTRGQGIGGYGPPVKLRNTIIAANFAGRPDMEGSFESGGWNIIGSIKDGVNTIATITPNPGTADQIGVTTAQVHLGPLAANGGPTPTHELVSPSIAIDKGKSFGVTHDQRHLTRPSDNAAIVNAAGGDGADVGAFEVQASCGKPDDCCCRRVGRRLVGTCCPKTPPPQIRIPSRTQ
jgi:hypothetical protein